MDTTLQYALLAGAGMFLMAMLTAAWMLQRDMRGQERYFSRVRQIHGEERFSVVKVERVPLREMISRTISGLGQTILNCGLVPVATKGQLETMLRAAGIRSENSVGVFFGAKMGMMVVLPLLVWLLIRHLNWSDLLVTFLPIATGVLGLMLPDLDRKSVV